MLQNNLPSIDFKFSELIDFDDYEPEVKYRNFKKVAKKLGILKTEFGFQSKDGLEMYALESEKLLLIFAIGEIQSSRYMIILEGVFEVK